MTIRAALDFIHTIVLVMRIDVIRILAAVVIGILISLLIKKYRYILSSVFTVLVYHLTSKLVRFFDCPIDIPLWCTVDCDGFYQPVHLADIFNMSQDYILYWSVFIGFLILVSGLGLWYLSYARKIYKILEGMK